VQHGQWTAALMLAGAAIALLATPPLDAAISRAAERAADHYALAVGAGPDLAQALLRISDADSQKGWIGRLLDNHPSVASRVESLGTGEVAAPTRTAA
jgi:Zn-dependent protease with chaperone function